MGRPLITNGDYGGRGHSLIIYGCSLDKKVGLDFYIHLIQAIMMGQAFNQFRNFQEKFLSKII